MTITFFNQKGGVGKTTTALLLSDFLDNQNKKILLIDLDPQGTLTNAFLEEPHTSLWDYFTKVQPLTKVVTSLNQNVDLLPASIFMSNMPQKDSTELLVERDFFRDLFKNYDYAIIDCPPNLSTLSRLGLLLSDKLFMPVEATKFSYDALKDGIHTINTISVLNPNLKENFKVFQNQSQKNRAIKKSYEELFKEELKENWLNFSLPNITKIQERPVTGENFFQGNQVHPQVLDFFYNLERLIHE